MLIGYQVVRSFTIVQDDSKNKSFSLRLGASAVQSF